jgi:hypothetical protein
MRKENILTKMKHSTRNEEPLLQERSEVSTQEISKNERVIEPKFDVKSLGNYETFHISQGKKFLIFRFTL